MNATQNDACLIGPDPEILRQSIREEYTRLASFPDDDFHFHRGMEYAVHMLRYDRHELETLPQASVKRFAGLGNPHLIAPIRFGETVLDVGCGAGMDLLLAARRVGPWGRAIGVDPTPAMLRVAEQSARELGVRREITLMEGSFEDLPLADASVDVVISNGVLNLNPDKAGALREVRRVLKPGGRLQLADAMVLGAFKQAELENPALWAHCVAGATTEKDLVRWAKQAGFTEPRLTHRFHSFTGTLAGMRIASRMMLHAVNFSARVCG
jgi:arsenite methyltransferase